MYFFAEHKDMRKCLFLIVLIAMRSSLAFAQNDDEEVLEEPLFTQAWIGYNVTPRPLVGTSFGMSAELGFKKFSWMPEAADLGISLRGDWVPRALSSSFTDFVSMSFGGWMRYPLLDSDKIRIFIQPDASLGFVSAGTAVLPQFSLSSGFRFAPPEHYESNMELELAPLLNVSAENTSLGLRIGIMYHATAEKLSPEQIAERNARIDEEKARVAAEKELREAERLAARQAREAEREARAAEKARLAEEKARQREEERLAREAAKLAAQQAREAEREAREAEKARIAAEKAQREEEERLAREAEKARIAAEKAQREEEERLAREAEKARREEEARLAREAEEARIAAEQERLAREAEEARQREIASWPAPYAELSVETVEGGNLTPDGDGLNDALIIKPSVHYLSEPEQDWEIVISDSKGGKFRSFQGTAPLPEAIVWDGLSDTGETVFSLNNYNVELSITPSAADQERIGRLSVKTAQNVRTGLLMQVIIPGKEWKIMVNSIFFDPDKATFNTLSPAQIAANNEALDAVVAEIIAHPGTDVIVEGFANNISNTVEENERELLPLSQERADSIVKQLILRGIPANILSSQGMGDASPLAAWEDVANWWKNRRVEFILRKD